MVVKSIFYGEFLTMKDFIRYGVAGVAAYWVMEFLMMFGANS